MFSGERIPQKPFGKRKGNEAEASTVPETQKAPEASESGYTHEELLDLAEKFDSDSEFSDTLRTLARLIAGRDTGETVPDDNRSRVIDPLLNEANEGLKARRLKPIPRETFFADSQ